MSDPRSIMEGPPRDAFENSLLDAARGDRMPESSRARVLQTLGIMPLAGAELACEPVSSAHATASAGLQPAFWGWGKILGLAGVIVPAAAVGGWLLLSSSGPSKALAAGDTSQVTVSSSVQSDEAQVDAARPAEPAAAQKIVSLEDLPADEIAASDKASTKSAGATPGQPTQADKAESGTGAASTLAEELGAIRSARSTLSAGQPAAALDQLNAYAAQFPQGRLHQEATVLRVEALLAVGERQKAEKLAQPFLEQNSAYASRLRSLLAR